MQSLYEKINKELDDKFNNEYSYFIYTKFREPLLGNKKLVEAEKLKMFSEDKFIEGRIFNEKYELRIFYNGEEFVTKIVYKEELKDQMKIKRKYLINKTLHCKENKFKYIEVIEYLEKDEDGEYRVKSTCLDKLN